MVVAVVVVIVMILVALMVVGSNSNSHSSSTSSSSGSDNNIIVIIIYPITMSWYRLFVRDFSPLYFFLFFSLSLCFQYVYLHDTSGPIPGCSGFQRDLGADISTVPLEVCASL